MYEIRETLCQCIFNHDYEGIKYMYYDIKYRYQMLEVLSSSNICIRNCKTILCIDINIYWLSLPNIYSLIRWINLNI